MSKIDEKQMIDAHRLGRMHASEEFAMRMRIAMDRFKSDHEAQFAYLAGFVAEFYRLSKTEGSSP